MARGASASEELPAPSRPLPSEEPERRAVPPVDLPSIALHAPAPRIAIGILYFALSAVLLQTTVNLLSIDPRPAVLFICLGCFAPIYVMQLVHSLPRAKALRERYRYWTLPAQAVLTYAPILVLGRSWGAAAGFLAASMLLLLPGRASWAMFGLVAGSMGVLGIITDSGLVGTLYMVVSTMMSGLMVFGLSRLSNLVTELHQARGQLARIAVAQERLRFARDLHDLLGYSLSSITLKSEVAIRLVSRHPDRTRDELASILDISRQALADVRAVASSYRDMSLISEAASAEAILATADITAHVKVACEPLSDPADTVLATVLREGVTNMLRHSKVQHCRIEADERGGVVTLSIVNDGLGSNPDATPEPRRGSGIDNLRARVQAVGGRLTAGVCEDGLFQLVAEVPRNGRR